MSTASSGSHQAPHPGQSSFSVSGMYVFVGSMVFTILFFIYVSFFSGGVKIQEVREAKSAPVSAEAGAKTDAPAEPAPAAETAPSEAAPAAAESK